MLCDCKVDIVYWTRMNSNKRYMYTLYILYSKYRATTTFTLIQYIYLYIYIYIISISFIGIQYSNPTLKLSNDLHLARRPYVSFYSTTPTSHKLMLPNSTLLQSTHELMPIVPRTNATQLHTSPILSRINANRLTN